MYCLAIFQVASCKCMEMFVVSAKPRKNCCQWFLPDVMRRLSCCPRCPGQWQWFIMGCRLATVRHRHHTQHLGCIASTQSFSWNSKAGVVLPLVLSIIHTIEFYVLLGEWNEDLKCGPDIKYPDCGRQVRYQSPPAAPNQSAVLTPRI